MKKIIVITVTLLVFLFLVSCNNEKDIPAAVTTNVTEEVTTPEEIVTTLPEPEKESYLSRVSDICDENTKDVLIRDGDDVSIIWKSSKPALYSVDSGVGYVDKAYQTHREETVTVTVIYDDNGEKVRESKEIKVAPIKFTDLPSTPVATYFQTSAMYAYKQYNEDYKKNGEIFPEKARELLDVVYYAFGNLTVTGAVSIGDSSYVGQVRELHRDNVRVVLSIAGTSTDACNNFIKVTSDTKLLKTFVTNVMDLIDKNGMDGVDIDWEAVTSTVCPNPSGMNRLMKALREEMDARQADGGSPYFLSCAVPASSWGTGSDRFDFKTLDKYVDYVNLMSYDMNKTDTTSHLSPLYPSQNDKGYKFGCVYGVERLTSLGLSKSKIMIGCAGYGKTYRITGKIPDGAKYPGLGIAGEYIKYKEDTGFFKGTVYSCAVDSMISSGKFEEITEYSSDGSLVGSYLYNKDENVFVTYDSHEAYMAKYDYAASMDGVGIMSWSYPEDTSNRYINALYEAFTRK